MKDYQTFKPLEVEVRESPYGDSAGELDRAMKRLRRMMVEDHVLQEVRTRQAYEKPSEKRRRKRRQAKRRRARMELKQR